MAKEPKPTDTVTPPLNEDQRKNALAEDVAKRKAKPRTAEEYLNNILSVSQYIDNVAVVLETALKEMNSKGRLKQVEAVQADNRTQEADLLIMAATDAKKGADLLKSGLAAVEELATGSRRLGSMQPIWWLKNAATFSENALSFIANQKGHIPNIGLSDDTIINAQAALDVMKNKLTRVVAGDANMEKALTEYNDSYAKRMAAAQRNNKGGRIEVYKAKLADKAFDAKDLSQQREHRRTGIGSFREIEEAKKVAEQAAESSPGRS